MSVNKCDHGQDDYWCALSGDICECDGDFCQDLGATPLYSHVAELRDAQYQRPKSSANSCSSLSSRTTTTVNTAEANAKARTNAKTNVTVTSTLQLTPAPGCLQTEVQVRVDVVATPGQSIQGQVNEASTHGQRNEIAVLVKKEPVTSEPHTANNEPQKTKRHTINTVSNKVFAELRMEEQEVICQLRKVDIDATYLAGKCKGLIKNAGTDSRVKAISQRIQAIKKEIDENPYILPQQDEIQIRKRPGTTKKLTRDERKEYSKRTAKEWKVKMLAKVTDLNDRIDSIRASITTRSQQIEEMKELKKELQLFAS